MIKWYTNFRKIKKSIMQLKKIILTPKSGLNTTLESDTILSYIFAFNFEKLKDIYKKFQDGKDLPFLITSWFNEWFLPKPIYFSKWTIEIPNTSILEDIKDEVSRKELKKISYFPIEKEFFELQFTWEQINLKNKIKNYLEDKKVEDNREIRTIEYKNSIPRFNIWETNPYTINDIKYTNWNYVIYIKIYDNDDFDLFFNCFKNTFESIWFWKGKSIWYWQFSKIEIKDLDNKEIEVFHYFDKLEKDKKLKIVLNNYKPKNEEINNFNLKESYYKLNNKHTKSLSEFNKVIFKWKMSFIDSWSVISCNSKLVWWYYKSGKSYNFGYIF